MFKFFYSQLLFTILISKLLTPFLLYMISDWFVSFCKLNILGIVFGIVSKISRSPIQCSMCKILDSSILLSRVYLYPKSSKMQWKYERSKKLQTAKHTYTYVARLSTYLVVKQTLFFPCSREFHVQFLPKVVTPWVLDKQSIAIGNDTSTRWT